MPCQCIDGVESYAIAPARERAAGQTELLYADCVCVLACGGNVNELRIVSVQKYLEHATYPTCYSAD